MTYPVYSEYKDSKVAWFGIVPNHWKVAGFKKYLNKIVDYRGKTPEKTDSGVFLVTARNIKNGIIDYDRSQEFIAVDDYENVMSRGKPKVGEVLFTTEAPLGEVACVDREGIALAQRIIKFSGKNGIVNNAFLKYLIMSVQFQQSLMMYATGSTALGIKAERLVYLRMLIPSVEEQTQIATFLDRETQKIDRLIEKQQQLIKLLQEKRQAVISHAVTKGLNPNAKMKDSGVEWLGDIPEDWDVCRIKNVAILNPSKSEARHLSGDELVSFIPMEAIGEQGELDVSRIKAITEVINGYTYVADGDVMIAKITPCFENGKGAIARNLKNGIGFATTEVIPIRPYRESDEMFLYYLLNSDPFKSLATGSMYGAGGQKRVSDNFVAEYHCAYPPVNERDAIVFFIDDKLKKIDSLISGCDVAVDLLKERRTALISAAVTGKIDVRNVING